MLSYDFNVQLILRTAVGLDSFFALDRSRFRLRKEENVTFGNRFGYLESDLISPRQQCFPGMSWSCFNTENSSKIRPERTLFTLLSHAKMAPLAGHLSRRRRRAESTWFLRGFCVRSLVDALTAAAIFRWSAKVYS